MATRLPRRQPTVLFPRARSRSVGRSTLLRRIALVCGVPLLAVAAAWLAGFLWLHLPENLLGQ
jgi:hypothetical protein